VLLRTVQEYKKTLEIVRNQFKAGYSVTEADVATAEGQVFSTQSQPSMSACYAPSMSTPSRFGWPAAGGIDNRARPLIGAIPKLPVSVPSALLERRPDIAAAERTMQEQNALIGVQMAAYFPDISLSAVLQWSGSRLFPSMWRTRFGHWAARPHRSCLTADCAGRRSTPRARFIGKASPLIANRAFSFPGSRGRTRCHPHPDATAGRATEGCQLSAGGRSIYLNQFQGGTAPFTTVVTAQIQLLSFEVSELTIRQNLFLASVALIQDLGGGWDVNLLPTKKELESDLSLLPQLPPNRAGLRLQSPDTSASAELVVDFDSQAMPRVSAAVTHES